MLFPLCWVLTPLYSVLFFIIFGLNTIIFGAFPIILGSINIIFGAFSIIFGSNTIIAEPAERSPIIIQNSSNPSSRKNLDERPYDRTIVQGATFNMRGQLYRGHANATALFSSPVVSALGSESDDSSSSPGRGKALCP